MIETWGLRKRFGRIEAVRDVGFRARDGSVTGLLGPNGAGKTTTLRMLSGLMAPDAGSVRVDGVDVSADPVGARRTMGLLLDARGLYPRLTTREHVEYFGRLQGIRGGELRARCDQAIADLGLTEIADRRVEGFSQGQRTKVALARALVHRPGNVILDEPTNGLDVTSARTMRTFVRGLRDAGCCVVLSSHIMQEISALCDQVVVIARGTVVADGTPAALMERTGCVDLEDAFIALTEEAARESLHEHSAPKEGDSLV